MNKFLTLNLRGRLQTLQNPLVMAIVNVTPDSFYAESRVATELLSRCQKMLEEGAVILDLGGQSTRPGASRISAKDELNRVLPAIQLIAREFPDAAISIDTFYAEVARAAVEHGACMINDISAGQLDVKMFDTVASLRVPYVLMHMQGVPETMQINPQYTDVMGEVTRFFSEKILKLRSLGVIDIILDPGFGFGKSLEHNYCLLHHFHEFGIFDLPLLAGLSRKGMIQKVVGRSADDALTGTIAANTIALMKGANILRVHDVKEASEAIAIFQAMESAK